VGDEVTVLPSGIRTRISAIDSFEGPLARASAPMSVVLRLADEVDAARGDLLSHPGTAPAPRDRVEATLVWLSERPLDPSRAYLVKHTTRTVPARVAKVVSRLDLESLEEAPAAGLALNDIGRVVVTCARPVICDAYARNRATGAFILIDALTNETAAAGIVGAGSEASARAARELPSILLVQGDDEEGALRLAHEIERFLSASGHLAAVVRHSRAALACAAAGVVAVVPVPSGEGDLRAALRDCGVSALEVGADWARALEGTLPGTPR